VAWVFQGNPKKFDIDDYVTRYPELIYWRTPTYSSRIAVGDRAFIWRSGPNAGVIGIGVVVEAPIPGTKVKHPEALREDLWRVEKPDSDEEKTGIHLQDLRLTVEEGFVSRSMVKGDAELAQASIITIPQGTVFSLTPAQTAALERLWGLRASASTLPLEGESEGARRLQAHYRRERSRALRDKKLAEVRERNVCLVCALCSIDETSRYPAPLGQQIFEVHHLAPLAKATEPVCTTLDDLVVLCANCHKAVHATMDVGENYRSLVAHFRR
jgi:hypothetical protein